jgi:hypothetical protein
MVAGVMEHGEGQDREDEKLAPVEVLQRGDLLVGHLAEQHALDHPQRVGRAQHQRRAGQQRIPEVGLEAGEDDEELADEARGAGQPGVGHREQHQEGRTSASC